MTSATQNTEVTITNINALTIDLKDQDLQSALLTIKLAHKEHNSYSVSILNRRLNEKHFRIICQLLASLGLKNLDMTYDIWAKDLYVVQDTSTLRTVGIPFNTEYSATNWLSETFKSTKPQGTTQKQEDIAFKLFEAEYRVIHSASLK